MTESSRVRPTTLQQTYLPTHVLTTTVLPPPPHTAHGLLHDTPDSRPPTLPTRCFPGFHPGLVAQNPQGLPTRATSLAKLWTCFRDAPRTRFDFKPPACLIISATTAIGTPELPCGGTLGPETLMSSGQVCAGSCIGPCCG